MSTVASVLDLVLPRRCVGCGADGVAWCRSCLPITAPLRVGSPESATAAAAAYDGAVRAALLRYKERGRRDLGPPLAGLLARAVAAVLAGERSPPGAVTLVPVPSSRRAAAARGGDHLRRLAYGAARSTGARVDTPLRLQRAVADSVGLSAAERAANLCGAFTARLPDRRGPARAVLVDDIVTTGATLHEAREALLAAGWRVVGAAVVAATGPTRAAIDLDHPLAPPR